MSIVALHHGKDASLLVVDGQGAVERWRFPAPFQRTNQPVGAWGRAWTVALGDGLLDKEPRFVRSVDEGRSWTPLPPLEGLTTFHDVGLADNAVCIRGKALWIFRDGAWTSHALPIEDGGIGAMCVTADEEETAHAVGVDGRGVFYARARSGETIAERDAAAERLAATAHGFVPLYIGRSLGGRGYVLGACYSMIDWGPDRSRRWELIDTSAGWHVAAFSHDDPGCASFVRHGGYLCWTNDGGATWMPEYIWPNVARGLKRDAGLGRHIVGDIEHAAIRGEEIALSIRVTWEPPLFSLSGPGHDFPCYLVYSSDRGQTFRVLHAGYFPYVSVGFSEACTSDPRARSWGARRSSPPPLRDRP